MSTGQPLPFDGPHDGDFGGTASESDASTQWRDDQNPVPAKKPRKQRSRATVALAPTPKNIGEFDLVYQAKQWRQIADEHCNAGNECLRDAKKKTGDKPPNLSTEIAKMQMIVEKLALLSNRVGIDPTLSDQATSLHEATRIDHAASDSMEAAHKIVLDKCVAVIGKATDIWNGKLDTYSTSIIAGHEQEVEVLRRQLSERENLSTKEAARVQEEANKTASEVSALKAEVVELRRQHLEQQLALQDKLVSKLEHSAIQKKLEEEKRESKLLRESMTKWKTRYDSLQSALEETRANASKAAEQWKCRIKELEQVANTKTMEIDSLASSNHDLAFRIQTYELVEPEFKSRILHLENALDCSRTTMSLPSQEVENLRQTIKLQKAEITRLESEKTARVYDLSLEQLKEELQAVTKTLQNRKESLLVVKEKYKTTSQSLKVQEKELQTAQESLRAVGGELKMTIQTLRDRERDLQRTQHDLHTANEKASTTSPSLQYRSTELWEDLRVAIQDMRGGLESSSDRDTELQKLRLEKSLLSKVLTASEDDCRSCALKDRRSARLWMCRTLAEGIKKSLFVVLDDAQEVLVRHVHPAQVAYSDADFETTINIEGRIELSLQIGIKDLPWLEQILGCVYVEDKEALRNWRPDVADTALPVNRHEESAGDLGRPRI